MRPLTTPLRTLLRPTPRLLLANPVVRTPLRFRPQPATPIRCLQNLASSKFSDREQPRLRLGTEAPNFIAETTHGKIDFHE